MSAKSKRVLICNCEKSMKMDGKAIARAFGETELTVHTNLCRSQIGVFEGALESGDEIVVACTQESPLFAEVAEEGGREVAAFVNIRETAGWTTDKTTTAPKMAALIAAASLPIKPARLRTIASDGLCLVMGEGQAAFDAAAMLNRSLSVTLLLTGADDILLPAVLDFPVFRGKVSMAHGSLGAFDVVVDGYAAMLPSSRGEPQFGLARDGAKSNCSVLFDMTGDAALFPRPTGRDGYFRAEPRDPAAVMRAVFEASAYEGEFEKPIYVSYDASICAHERSKKTGCTKCIDNCPPSAITPAGDEVLIDADICGGCGNCAAHCPTGAVSYDYPARTQLVERVQTLAQTYLAAGGKSPVLLVHDRGHGASLINAMARLGRGLPANVIPLELHSATGVGHDLMASALATGFRSLVVLVDPRKAGELDALNEEITLIDALTGGMALGDGRVLVLDAGDPDLVESALYDLQPAAEIARTAFAPVGGKREVARAAIAILAKAGHAESDLIQLPESAPYGAINVDQERCTLCMACVSACPADALRDNPDKPQLRFVESACVQCGICAATCPETAISLEPRYNFAPTVMQPVTLNEDEPAECIRCGTPFAARGMLDKVKEKLGGKHWMFQSEERVALLQMCESCRLEALAADGGDPFAIAHRSRIRTTDDYLEAGKRGLSIDDFFSED
ncbi:4Fe-4S binding protein [Aurantimonas sp. C2-6-R+9]|uniref:4Fe-4S binding protein n=1 Tax=unclassified Aurantimonas TaxID=2638230 RepID=UPI002E177D84|nr:MULTISPECIES: 4Fe-4S binding protein [unclassified Aurantimonas]MEC5289478.1 4Fe-4S binding protein [Aurantimonas sp. C2-3-R2]MEC5380835.1 4Fe-4S binding protein [Aurantimonas sp. C2-6-R+9]MEC5410559.1 4Fe-4S binding protein [Aurantimonas sp. C2-4-R8]